MDGEHDCVQVCSRALSSELTTWQSFSSLLHSHGVSMKYWLADEGFSRAITNATDRPWVRRSAWHWSKVLVLQKKKKICPLVDFASYLAVLHPVGPPDVC